MVPDNRWGRRSQSSAGTHTESCPTCTACMLLGLLSRINKFLHYWGSLSQITKNLLSTYLPNFKFVTKKTFYIDNFVRILNIASFKERQVDKMRLRCMSTLYNTLTWISMTIYKRHFHLLYNPQKPVSVQMQSSLLTIWFKCTLSISVISLETKLSLLSLNSACVIPQVKWPSEMRWGWV